MMGYQVELPSGGVVNVETLEDVVRLERRLKAQGSAPSSHRAAILGLDAACPGWRGIELDLDDWSARGSLKRAGVRTLGDLADVLARGRQFRAISFFRSLWRALGDDTACLRDLVFNLFEPNPAIRKVVQSR